MIFRSFRLFLGCFLLMMMLSTYTKFFFYYWWRLFRSYNMIKLNMFGKRNYTQFRSRKLLVAKYWTLWGDFYVLYCRLNYKLFMNKKKYHKSSLGSVIIFLKPNSINNSVHPPRSFFISIMSTCSFYPLRHAHTRALLPAPFPFPSACMRKELFFPRL